MGADLARLRRGKKTRTGMSEGQLSDFASKRKGKMTARKQGDALKPRGR